MVRVEISKYPLFAQLLFAKRNHKPGALNLQMAWQYRNVFCHRLLIKIILRQCCCASLR